LLAGAAASAGQARPRSAVRIAVAPVVRDTVLAAGVVPVTLQAPRAGRVTVRLRLVDAAGGTLAASRGFSVRLRGGRARRLSLPPGDAIVRTLQACGGRRMVVDVAPRRGAPLRQGQATAPVGFVPPVCGRFFADDAVWNRAVPADAPLDPASAALSGELLRQVQADVTSRRGPWMNTTRFSVPIYTVSARQPRVSVALASGSDPSLRQALSDVPLPPTARPSPDSDAELVVWQPATDTLWEFWRLRRDPDGQWRADSGGRIDSASRSPGYFQAPHADWGVAASGLSIAGGLITVPELRRGRIDHALALAIPDVRADAFALPATRTDGRSAGATRVPEGAHFRLDPTLDLDRLGLPPVTRMVAEAAQRYGLIVRDRAGGVVLYSEDPAPLGADPYPALLGGSPSDVLRPFPWDRLQLLRMDLRPAPSRPPDPGCALLALCP
jgi:hypothetical protein